jgi:(p)ppGpp synthase/HD superfamily hydrolase
MGSMAAYSPLIEKAARMAIVAHAEHRRKSDDFPYIVHPFMVASILLRHGFSDEIVAASLVHDVVEDAEITVEEVGAELGITVAEMVTAVSELPKESAAWKERKRAYIESIRGASDGARAVSVADKIHNAASMLAAYREEGERFWVHFSGGKDSQLWFFRELLAVYRETWQHPIIEEYATLMEELDHATRTV